MKKYICTICGYIYDEALGIPTAGIPAGTKWEDLPNDWVCPLCGAAKSDFKEQLSTNDVVTKDTPIREDETLRELSIGELSSLCSNLARGCEKQYLAEESALFTQLSDYFKSKTPSIEKADHEELYALVQKDLNEGLISANAIAGTVQDRGALRALVWTEKVSRILNSILSRYDKDGDTLLENTNIYVCESCGFIYVGEDVPILCPVCKVPSWKIHKVERR